MIKYLSSGQSGPCKIFTFFHSCVICAWMVDSVLHCTTLKCKLDDRKVLSSLDQNVAEALHTDYSAPLRKGQGVIIITALSAWNLTASRGWEPVEKGRRQAGQRMSKPDIHPE